MGDGGRSRRWVAGVVAIELIALAALAYLIYRLA
jgi:hypothetical protein